MFLKENQFPFQQVSFIKFISHQFAVDQQTVKVKNHCFNHIFTAFNLLYCIIRFAKNKVPFLQGRISILRTDYLDFFTQYDIIKQTE